MGALLQKAKELKAQGGLMGGKGGPDLDKLATISGDFAPDTQTAMISGNVGGPQTISVSKDWNDKGWHSSNVVGGSQSPISNGLIGAARGLANYSKELQQRDQGAEEPPPRDWLADWFAAMNHKKL